MHFSCVSKPQMLFVHSVFEFENFKNSSGNLMEIVMPPPFSTPTLCFTSTHAKRKVHIPHCHPINVK